MSSPVVRRRGSNLLGGNSASRVSNSSSPVGGVIVDEELSIPVPAPETCVPLPNSNRLSRRRHSSLDVISCVRKNALLTPKPLYRRHIYCDEKKHQRAAPFLLAEKEKLPTMQSIPIAVKPPKMSKPKALIKSLTTMFSVPELHSLLQGYAVLFTSPEAPANADYYLLFSEKAYAKKHLLGTVSDLLSYSLVTDDGMSLKPFSLSILQVSGNLSLRINLRKEYENYFYSTMSRNCNKLAIGSTDLPFSSDCAEMTDAQKKRLLYGVLTEVLGRRGQRLPDLLYPTHNVALRNRIWESHNSKLRFLFGDVNEQLLADYFGADTAFYFAWMNHYKKWLLGASILGLTSFLAEKLFHFSAESSPFAPVYTIFLIIGSVLCVKFWERKCHVLFMKFNMLHNQVKDGNNWQFKGSVILDPVTGQQKLYYPSWKRGCILQPIAWMISLFYMILTVIVTIVSANLDGIIGVDSRLAIPEVQALSADGGIFFKNSKWWWVPSVVYSLSTMTLGSGFNLLGRKITEFENYEHRGDFICAFTQKRVTLEIINRYAKLFLVAFVCKDLKEVSSTVRSIFISSELIRIFFETVFPFLTTYRSQLITILRGKVSNASELDENLQHYEVYSDFVEMAMQLGYIALFATAYSMAPVIVFFSNLVEMKCDLFKLCFVVRRPVPRYGSSQLSTWCEIFRLFATGAVLTNTYLFVFTGSQIKHILPSYFESEGEGAGISSHSVALFALMEHVMLVVCGFLFWRIPEIPKVVQDYIKKKSYLRAEKRKF